MSEPVVPGALDQVTLSTSEPTVALAFYDATLGALGLVRIVELVDEEEDDPQVEAVAWGAPDGAPTLWLVTAETVTTGLHLRFRAHSRAQVETFFAAALRSGGSPHAAPRRWTVYRRGEFNAIVRDPNGNLVEAVSGE